MYAASALRNYQQVSTQSQLAEASPHRLIQMLYQGALDRIAQAQGAMSRGEVSQKGVLISKAIDIVNGLRQALDKEKGGEYAQNLDGLYEFMGQRLLQANMSDDLKSLELVSSLLRKVKDGWDGIAPAPAPIQGA